MKKIVFMGSDPIALPLLEDLKSNQTQSVELTAIVTQPDRPQGRGKKLQANAIGKWAEANQLITFKPEKPGKPLRQWVEDNGIDLILVMAYGHIVSTKLLQTPPLGCLNFHASILPHYRGASPIETAIACGEKETGVSLMRMVKAMDAGPVADVETVPIHPQSTASDIRLQLAQATVTLFKRNILDSVQGTLEFQAQDINRVSYCRKLAKTDGHLDFNAEASELVARINGLDPWPGTFCHFNETRIKLRQAEQVSMAITPTAQPGQILSTDEGKITIAAGNGAIAIHQLQRPGGKMLPAKEFLPGFPLAIGSIIASQPMAALTSKQCS